MDDAPHTGDLDFGAANTRDDLAALLRAVYIRADKPSLRTLEVRTRHGTTPLSKTTVADMLKGVRLPRKAVMVAFLQACRVQDDGMEAWLRTWERVASSEERSILPKTAQVAPDRHGRLDHDYPPPENASDADPTEVKQLRDQIKQLSEANDWLRSQLTGKEGQTPEKFQPDDHASGREARSPLHRQSIWHFPENSDITLVSYRLNPDRRPPSADQSALDYIRLASLADLDSLIDIHGAIRAYNPTSQVVIMAAQDLTHREVANHLVLIGGLTWKTVTPWFSRIFPIPIEAGDPGHRGAIVVQDPDTGEREFKYTITDGRLVEDVGFFAYGENPSAPHRTLTIFGGITTRGVHGAARCFIDWERQQRNEQYLKPQLRDGCTYCIVMRVPIVNNSPLTPDLSKKKNRLFEWRDISIRAE